MIPVGDNTASRRLAPMTTLLVVANVLVYMAEARLWGGVAAVAGRFGLVPANLAHPFAGQPGQGVLWPPLTLLTSLFLHIDLAHIAGNMLFLFIFGAAVEERLGAVRFLLFYLLAGVVSGVATAAMAPRAMVTVVGASGAIAGVLGAYFIFYPRSRIRTFLPRPLLPRPAEIPAVIYLLVWFAMQLEFAIESDPALRLSGGVAWWAHVGGFLFGVAAGPLFSHTQPASRKRRRRSC